MVLDWNSESWEIAKVVNSRAVYNRPLNSVAVRNELAQKICRALFNNFAGLEASILFAGTEGDTNHRYYVMLPKAFVAKLASSKMRELRAFVSGYVACARSFE